MYRLMTGSMYWRRGSFTTAAIQNTQHPIQMLQQFQGEMAEYAKQGFMYICAHIQNWLKTKGAIKWLCDAGKRAQDRILAEQMAQATHLPLTEDFAKSAFVKDPTLHVPHTILNCHACHKYKDIHIKKCGACKSVGLSKERLGSA